MIAAIYARKSTAQDVQEEQKSVARQVDNARAFAVAQGWTVDDAWIFIDDGVSGAETRRLLAKQRLLALTTSGRCPFDVVVMQAQDRFSRRDGDEAFSELKQLAKRVQVWFYADRRRFEYGTLATNVVGMLGGEFAAEFRRAIAQKTYEAHRRRAERGYVTGGRLFGYDNVRLEGRVERRINEAEAAVVRDIFTRGAAGEGLKTIAKALNATATIAPRARRDRAGTWSPSSVREVLHRETYRGVLTWNRTKKRDMEGQQRPHDRPRADWVTIPAEHLRLVPEALWCAVQDRRRAKRVRAGADAPPLRVGRGIRQKYFLAGFGRCSRCGGSMQAVSRPAAGGGRRFHYACGAYWNRGATVCSNGLLVALPAADQAVRDLVRGEVLRPGVVERALAGAVTTLQQETQDGSHVARLTAQLAGLDRELANLAETAARGGAVPAVLALLDDREQQRRRVLADLAQAQRVQAAPGVTPAALQACLRGVLGDWDGLLSGPDTVEARGVLEAVLTDRIRFTPDRDQHRYRLTLPVAFDRLLDAAVPALAGLSRNGGVPRPTCSLP